jgi:hypothetical protein
MGFEPTIPASERAKTVHALDRSATVTDIVVNMRLILKYISKRWGMRVWTEFRRLRIGYGVCEHGDEPSDRMKVENVFSS